MKAEGWAVVGPDGQIMVYTVEDTEQRAKNRILDGMVAWANRESEGYRCVPVTIEGRSRP